MTSNPETSLQTATDLLTPWCEKLTKPEANRADVVVSRTNLLPAVQALRDAKWGFLSAITGLDHMKPAPAAAKPLDPAITAAKPETIAEPPPPLEVLYHFLSPPQRFCRIKTKQC
jgi:NADH:ubiquinone oxidoreductase subunit C